MKKIISLFLVFIMSFSITVVFAEDEAENMVNIALGKTATATNQYSTAYPPKNVVDGNEYTAYSSGSQEIGVKINGHNSLVIDLGATYNLFKVVVKSRRDLDQGPMRAGWILEAANTPSFKDSVQIGTKPVAGDNKSDLVVTFKEPHIARYLLLRSTNSSFVVAEFEAYGEKYAGKSQPVFEDVSDSDYSAVQLMYTLGILEGISSTEFGVNKLVRREEVAKIVALGSNLNASSDTISSFSDVVEDNEYLGYIETCADMSIISKGNNYRPEDFIKAGEFLKMVTSAMGYNAILSAIGTYPQNVMQLANDLNITKGLSVSSDTYLNYSDIAKILYNALLTPVSAVEEAFDENNSFSVLYTEGDTMLKKAFGLELRKGIVEENDITSLISSNKAGKDSIVINNISYFDESSTLFEYIGQNIYYLADDENNVKGGWENKLQNEVYTVYTKDINHSNTNPDVIEVFDEKGETEEFDLNSPLYVLKNGVAFDDYDSSSLNFPNGKVKLIDNNNDGVIDVLHILEPKVIIVDYISNVGKVLTLGGQNGEKAEAKNYSHFKCAINGRLLDVSEITKGNLIYAYISENGKSATLEVIRNAISGTVTEVRNDGLSINGEKYGFSQYYEENKGKLDSLMPGLKATFILDDHDNLVWISDSALGKVNDVLGFVQRVDVPQGIANVQIMVYNEDNQFITAETAEKVVLDGTTYNQTDLVNLLNQNPNYLAGRFVLYSTNSQGQISSFDTENYDMLKEPESKLIDMGVTLSGSERRVAGGIYSSHSMVLPILHDFPMFVIPVDSNYFPLIGESYNEFYSVSTVNKKLPNGDINIGGKTKFFGADEYGSPTLAVNLYVVDSSLSTIGTVKSLSADGFIVDSVIKQLNSKKEECYAIIGFDLGSKTRKTMVVKDTMTGVIDSYKIHADLDDSSLPANEKPKSSWFTMYRMINGQTDLTGIEKYVSPITTLNRGDVLRYQLTDEVATALERVYKNETDVTRNYGKLYSAGDHYMNISSSFRVYYAGFKSYKNDIMTINTSSTTTEIINCNTISGGFYVVENGRVLKYDIKDIPVYCSENTKLVVISKTGTYNSIIAYLD